ncbi:MAG: hypothetical protein M1838_006224 [Thelocarpon superellum]|nr:MAG: hypothetical protein M1838_006224 [Thelocarpon superellum]
MAEGVFRHLSARAPPPAGVLGTKLPVRWDIDSCGTGAYHTGDPPDTRTMSTLEDHGIDEYVHAARKVQKVDFRRFDYILAMDRANLAYLLAMRRKLEREAGGGKGEGKEAGEGAPKSLARVMLFGDFGGNLGEEVDDPYYGARDGFELAYHQMVRFSQGFLDHVARNDTAKP